MKTLASFMTTQTKNTRNCLQLSDVNPKMRQVFENSRILSYITMPSYL